VPAKAGRFFACFFRLGYQKFKKKGIKTKNPDKPCGSSGFRNTSHNRFDFEENAAEKLLRVPANRVVLCSRNLYRQQSLRIISGLFKRDSRGFLVRAFAGRSRKTWPLEEPTWVIPLRVCLQAGPTCSDEPG